MKNNVSFNSGLAKFGMGLFETMQIIDEKPIFINEHIDRLYNSINELELPFNTDSQTLRNSILNQCKGYTNKAIRVTVFDEGYNFSLRDIPYTQKEYLRGFDLTIAPFLRGNNSIYKHKTTNYFENIICKTNAQKNNCDEAVITNYENIVLEGSMSNIFFIKNDTLYTPNKNLNILSGIIRDKIIEIAEKNHISISEEPIEIAKIKEFKSCFITNSLINLMNVNRIDDKMFYKDNEIYIFLKEKLRELIYDYKI